MAKYTNKLIGESSPYLLQHAHNPVNWYPWGPEALELAQSGDKPILVSIGYSACHWCHVMERESFEDPATAEIMNQHFINIKIDREERPDLDHIYMDAVQAMTGSGGWPLNVFLTPDRRPFYGGTYFPPVRAFNRSSWKEILLGVSRAFTERRSEIEAQADNLTGHIRESNGFGLQAATEQARHELFSRKRLEEAFANCMKTADRTWGGFGNAPKFPQTFVIRFLLQYSLFTKDETALQQARLSLDKMIAGGIYDQLGGGFARYATDTEWLVPHFEKMLYDNALLIDVIAEAYQLTGELHYRETIDETIAFVRRELMDESGGFYAALDADSEGEEGRYYVWDREEVQELLGNDARIFCSYYDITAGGNWEGKNILRTKHSVEEFAALEALDPKLLKQLLANGKGKLLAARAQRVRPGLDDKIILGWNALMNTACSKSFAATGKIEYRELAIRNMNFLVDSLSANDKGEFYHTYKNGAAKQPAFVDDYAFLVEALLHLYEITAEPSWLLKARDITLFVIDHFSEEESGFFFFTKKGQDDVILRKKEVYDGAVPSGNAVMAYNLHRLGIYFDKADWKERAVHMTVSLGRPVINYPSSFGMWTCFLQELIYSTHEIVILGKEFKLLLEQVLTLYIPNKVIMGSKESDFYYPLLAGKDSKDSTLIYLCKDFACRQPVNSVAALIELISQ